MIKVFCDRCGVEVDEDRKEEYIGPRYRHELTGEYCNDCMEDYLKKFSKLTEEQNNKRKNFLNKWKVELNKG